MFQMLLPYILPHPQRNIAAFIPKLIILSRIKVSEIHYNMWIFENKIFQNFFTILNKAHD